jgi:hypothetical protein
MRKEELRRPRLLWVKDNPRDCLPHANRLQRTLGARIVLATSPDEAKDFLQRMTYDVLILDLTPNDDDGDSATSDVDEHSGIKLLRELREGSLSDDNRHIPVRVHLSDASKTKELLGDRSGYDVELVEKATGSLEEITTKLIDEFS